ncbi:transcriptional regulator, partial [Pseudomonas aeruginosa]
RADDMLPKGTRAVKEERNAGTIARIVGLHAGKTKKVARLEEVKEGAAQGWAGKQ